MQPKGSLQVCETLIPSKYEMREKLKMRKREWDEKKNENRLEKKNDEMEGERRTNYGVILRSARWRGDEDPKEMGIEVVVVAEERTG